MTSPSNEMAYEQRYRQEREEYGTWVAIAPITYDGVVVYRPGHAVPKSNVERYGYDTDGLVERVDGAQAAEENVPPGSDSDPADSGRHAEPPVQPEPQVALPAVPQPAAPPQGEPAEENTPPA